MRTLGDSGLLVGSQAGVCGLSLMVGLTGRTVVVTLWLGYPKRPGGNQGFQKQSAAQSIARFSVAAWDEHGQPCLCFPELSGPTETVEGWPTGKTWNCSG